jgi:predicted ester cyclase
VSPEIGPAGTTLLRVFAIEEAHEFDRLGEVLCDDVEIRLAGTAFQGLSQVRQMQENFFGAFPDLEQHVQTMTETPTRVCAQLHVTATHLGPLATAFGVIEPTGRAIEWFSGIFVEMRDGKVATWSIYLDQVALLASLGCELRPDSS